MSSQRTRRALLHGLGPAVALTAGCLGVAEQPGSTDGSDGTTTTTSTPPSISNGTAEQRALAAETEYVRTRLSNASCLDEWGVGEYTMESDATVVDRTSDGVVVDVQRPYSRQRDGSIADDATHPRYRVTENETERLTGEPVAPCR